MNNLQAAQGHVKKPGYEKAKAEIHHRAAAAGLVSRLHLRDAIVRGKYFQCSSENVQVPAYTRALQFVGFRISHMSG